jgi:elongator complex protein 2
VSDQLKDFAPTYCDYYDRSHQFHITFDALLVGHDAGVTALSWRPSLPRVLLSTSTDSSAILWSATTVGGDSDNPTQLWTNHQRFGDVGGQRLGGFVGGFWVDADQICAWTWNGGFRRWGVVSDQWQEMQAVTGHSSPVHGLDWEPAGRYLISAR